MTSWSQRQLLAATLVRPRCEDLVVALGPALAVDERPRALRVGGRGQDDVRRAGRAGLGVVDHHHVAAGPRNLSTSASPARR